MSSDSALSCVEFCDPIYGQNSRVVTAVGHRNCWLIDPGLPPATTEMMGYVKENNLEPECIILTHAHADHIAGLPEVLAECDHLPVYLAKQEWHFLTDPSENLSSMIGMGLKINVRHLEDLSENLEMALAGTKWHILDTSGHSPGGRTLYCQEQHIAIVGDALFSGSIGRTDFHHSNHDQLIGNIKENLLTLPPETQVLSGHGPDTTIGREKKDNPFVGERASNHTNWT